MRLNKSSFPRRCRFCGGSHFFWLEGFEKIRNWNGHVTWQTFVCLFFFPPDIVGTIGRLSKHSRCASANAGLSWIFYSSLWVFCGAHSKSKAVAKSSPGVFLKSSALKGSCGLLVWALRTNPITFCPFLRKKDTTFFSLRATGTLQGTNTSHLWKRKIIFKRDFGKRIIWSFCWRVEYPKTTQLVLHRCSKKGTGAISFAKSQSTIATSAEGRGQRFATGNSEDRFVHDRGREFRLEVPMIWIR